MLVGFDTEYGFRAVRRINSRAEPDVTTAVPVCAALAFEDGRQLVFRPDDHRLAAHLADPSHTFVVHGAHAEQLYCRLVGTPFPARHVDTLLAGVLLAHAREFRPLGGAYAQAGLATLAARFAIPFIGSNDKDVLRESILHLRHEAEFGMPAVEAYCLGDARACLRLAPLLLDAVGRTCGQATLTNLCKLYQPHAAVMTTAAARGIRLDQAGWARLKDRGRAHRRRLLAAAREHGYEHDGPRLSWTAFEKVLGRAGLLDEWPKTATGQPSTGRRDLKDRRRWHPAVEAVHQLARFDEALAQRLGERVDRDGRLRCGVLPFAQRSARTSTVRPNLLGLPGEMRPLLLPDPGCVWLHFDFTQHEPAVAAALSGDPELLADVGAGDTYLSLGRRMGLVAPTTSQAEARAVRPLLKQLMLSVLYGKTAAGLALDLKCSPGEAAAHLHLFELTYPRLAGWARSQVATSLCRGWAESVVGHRAAFTAVDASERGHVERSCRNFVFQASSAACHQATGVHLAAAGLDVRLGLHDAYLLNVPDDADELRRAERLVRAAARAATAELFPGLLARVEVEFLRRFAKDGREDSLDQLIHSLEPEDALCPTA